MTQISLISPDYRDSLQCVSTYCRSTRVAAMKGNGASHRIAAIRASSRVSVSPSERSQHARKGRITQESFLRWLSVSSWRSSQRTADFLRDGGEISSTWGQLLEKINTFRKHAAHSEREREKSSASPLTGERSIWSQWPIDRRF